MLFTSVQLDDFRPNLSHFIGHLNLEGAEEKEWIMMGIINIAARILQYECPSDLLRKPNVAKAAAGIPGVVVPEED
jgi:protein SMG6